MARKSLFQNAFMNKNLYQVFFSSSSASCAQWLAKGLIQGKT